MVSTVLAKTKARPRPFNSGATFGAQGTATGWRCRLVDLKFGRLGDGYGDLHYRQWLDAHLRPDGCDELRPWGFHCQRRFVASMLVAPLLAWTESDSILLNLAVPAIAVLGAMLVTGVIGLLFERIIIRPVYGQHLKQILITMGGMIVAEQLLTMIWGAEQIPFPLPTMLKGSIVIGETLIEKYRLFAVVIGLLVLIGMLFVLNRTKLGLLIRAGVENPEMVESLGYRIRRLFLLVFAAGSACAGLGGVMWGLYKETVSTAMSAELMVTVFIVVIIGGRFGRRLLYCLAIISPVRQLRWLSCA